MARTGPKLSVRLDFPGGRRFGPGKADLLQAIGQTGSISGGARALGMSYPRALRLVEDMNTLFKTPLVTTFQGGAKRGGAEVTATGEKILQLYRQTTDDALQANAKTLKAINAEILKT